MFDYLEQLRQKPEGAKKRFAFLTAFFVSGVIFVIWLSVIYPDLKNSKEKQDMVKDLEPSPFSSFVQNISYGFGQIGNSVAEIKNQVNLFSSEAEYVKTSASSTGTSTATVPVSEKPAGGLEIYNVSSSTEATSTKSL